MTGLRNSNGVGLAVVLGADGRISVQERAVSRPCGNEVLVRVSTAGCNRADLLQREGLYPAPPGAPADVPGLEFAGVVEDTGNAVLNLHEGDRVMGITAGGAQAEYLLIPEDQCVRVPSEVDLMDAGALPEAFFTAFEALVVQGGIRHGSRVLVNAVGSGVGTALVQLARALGARVVGTTRTAEKLKRCRELGLSDGVVISGHDEPTSVREQLREAAGGDFDLAVDLLGGGHLPLALSCLRVGGTAVSLGFISSAEASVNLAALVARRQRLIGTSLRSRPAFEKAALASRFSNEVLPLISSGVIRPVIDRRVRLAEAEKAYDALENNAAFGKILLTVGSGA